MVITDQSGAILRFLEKPGWGQVFSDTINTGIYVIEPRALAEVPADQPYDFSKELFPKLMAAGAPLYGATVDGYWCDIGNLAQLVQANEDALTGRVQLDIPGRHFPGDIWIAPGATVDPSARITGPVLVGENSAVRADVVVEGPAVLGPNSVLDKGCRLVRSTLLGNAFVGARAEVSGAVLGRGVYLGTGVVIQEGAVIGDGCHLNEGSQVRAEVKLWPNKVIEAQAVVNQSLVHGARWQRTLFSAASVGGVANVEVTAEAAVRLGAAYASVLQRGDALVMSRDSHPASVMLKRALMAGIASAGVRVYNLESTPLPVLRYAAGALGTRGGIFVHSLPEGACQLRFLDGRGVDIDASLERKVENLYFREDARKVAPEDVGGITYPAKVLDIYVTGYLAALGPLETQTAPPRVVLDYGGGTAGSVLPQVLAEYGVQALALGVGSARGPAPAPQDTSGITQIVRALHADCGLQLDPPGERITIVDDQGNVLGPQQALVLMAALASRHGRAQEIAVPITATAMVEAVCGSSTRVRRTRANSRALMEAASAGGLALAGDGAGGFSFPGFHPGIDGLFAVSILLHWLAQEGRPISQLMAELPEPAVASRSLPCPWRAKGQLMRRLVEATVDEQVTLLDGIKVHRGNSWLAILPDAARPLVHLFAEPVPGRGGHLLEEYTEMVSALVAEAQATAGAEAPA